MLSEIKGLLASVFSLDGYPELPLSRRARHRKSGLAQRIRFYLMRCNEFLNALAVVKMVNAR